MVTAIDTATVTVTATDTATTMAKATKKDRNSANNEDGASRTVS